MYYTDRQNWEEEAEIDTRRLQARCDIVEDVGIALLTQLRLMVDICILIYIYIVKGRCDHVNSPYFIIFHQQVDGSCP